MADIIPPRRDEPLSTESGTPTLRVSEFLESLGRSVNTAAGSPPAENITSNSFTIQTQIGSGDPLTWDETGFTWDSDKLSFDQTEA